MFRFFALLLFASIFSCKNSSRPAINKYVDELAVRIDDFKDKRLSDSLFQFLSDTNSTHRFDAVMAFASIQDTSRIEKLVPLLNDADASVRAATAYALGQTGGNKSSFSIERAIKNEKDPQVVKELLVALGKTGSLKSLINFPLGQLKDSLLLEGLSWSYYRLGVRGTTDSALNAKAVKFLNPLFKNSVRLAAVHFFHRGAKNIESASSELILCAQSDTDPEVRMAAVSALRKINTTESRVAIQHVLQKDTDYRVRVNAIRALQSFDFSLTKEYFFKALNDAHQQVGVASAEALNSIDTQNYRDEIVSKARGTKNWRIQANLFKAALKYGTNEELTEEVSQLFKQSTNNYQKAALLEVLGQSTSAVEFLRNQLLTADTHVIKSSAATALAALSKSKDADQRLKKTLAKVYEEAVKNGDVAVIGIISEVLGDSTLGYKSIISNIDFLHKAKSAMSLPKDNEALQAVEQAIAHFEGMKAIPVVNTFNHPLNWKRIKTISSDQLAKINTTKGNILLRLFVNEAPGSVSNFIELVEKNYFDSLYFHRVVPNFVVQVGCNRGDGWGSEVYSIRSEFSTRNYKAGSVGMASAGKDTEGTQWFITHSPTPHLDGRYTLFAEVIEGMDVVHKIEIGDRILDITLVLN